MRQLLFVLIIFGCAFLFASCKETPDKPIVIQKDQEQLLDTAKADTEINNGLSLKERYGIPEDLQFERASEDGKLTITADAVVIVPNVNTMPITNVKSAVFSQETVDKYWSELIGDAQTWEWSEQPTKADIEQMYIHIKQLMSETKDNESIAYLQERLASLENMYPSAPDATDQQAASSQLKEMLEWDPVTGEIDTRYIGFRACTAKNNAQIDSGQPFQWLSVHNPWSGAEGGIKPNVMSARIIYETQAVQNNYYSGPLVGADQQLVADAREHLSLTPQEAIAKVNDFFQKTDTPMVVDAMYVISDSLSSDGTGTWSVKTPEHYAYEIHCKRVVAGIPVGGKGGTMESEATYNKPWEYERFSIRLNDDGFIDMVWLAPLEIVNTEVEDCNLLPFDEVKNIFETMIFITSEADIQDGRRREYHISSAQLELMRIIKQNTDLEGLLVPVWNFYGTLAEYDDTDTQVGKSRFLPEQQLVLSINAIDGSIINPSKGY